VNIEERQPIARIFTAMGESFYIDSSGSRLPLNDKMNVRLPVFTNFTANRTTGLNKKSQQLVDDMKKVGFYVLNDKFWSAQVAQIDIVGDGAFEMVPTIGNHIIEFGNGNNYEQKFRRLFIFYKEVLSKTGFDKYSRIDVRYDRQVVGTKRGSVTKVDSVQAIRNIEKLIMAGIAPVTDTNQIHNN
jgi:cell division protein FtsQ